MQLPANTLSMPSSIPYLTTPPLKHPRRHEDRVFSPYSGLNPLWNRHVPIRSETPEPPSTEAQLEFHTSYQHHPEKNAHYAKGLLIAQPSRVPSRIRYDAFRRKGPRPVSLTPSPAENLLQLKQRLQHAAHRQTSEASGSSRPTLHSEETGSTVASAGFGPIAWSKHSISSASHEGNFKALSKVALPDRQALLSGETLLQLKRRLQAPVYRQTAEGSGALRHALRSTETGSTTASARFSHTDWPAPRISSASQKDNFNRLSEQLPAGRQALLQLDQLNSTTPINTDPFEVLRPSKEDQNTATSPFNVLGWTNKELANPAFMEEFMENPTFRRTILATPSFVEAIAVNPTVLKTFVSHTPEFAQELINTPTFIRNLPWFDALDLSENPTISHALSANPKAFVALWSYHPGIEDDDEGGDLLLTRTSFLKNLISHPEFVSAMLEAQTLTSRYLCCQSEIGKELGVQWGVAGKLMKHASLANALLENRSFAKSLVDNPHVALNLLAYPGFATAFANAFCSEKETGFYLNRLTRKLLTYPAFATAFAKQLRSLPFTDPTARYQLNRKLIANSQFQAELMQYPYFLNALKS